MKGVTGPRRVLFVCPQPYLQWRGSPLRVDYSLRALTAAGYAVDLLTLPIGEDTAHPGLRIIRVPGLPGVKDISIGPSALKLYFDCWLLVYGLVLILRHRYIVLHGVEEGGFIAGFLSLFSRGVLVVEKHSDLASYNKKGLLALVLKLYHKCEVWAGRRARGLIGTGPGLVEFWQKEAPARPAWLIPDIPSSLFTPSVEAVEAQRARYAATSDSILALYVGSFAAYQGLDLLFEALPEALRAAPHLSILVVGGSAEEITLRREQLAQESLADRVHFIGKLDPAAVATLLPAVDILLSPRIAGNNTPLKLLDYLKAGRAILATDHPSNRLILDNSVALLVETTPAAFATGLVRLAGDPAMRQNLTEGQAALLAGQYNFEFFSARLLECYERAQAR
jgi:glycosyltransferase involved in cell wall biosynthesis